jgi:quinol-cytochrome oxidoreductase complex cytochrome b subunit
MPDFSDTTLVVVVAIAVLIVVPLLARSLVRRMVVRMAEMAGILSIVLGTIAGGLSGYAYGRVLRLEFDAVEALPTLGAIAGGIAGFVIPAIAYSFLFLMIEIAENSRRTVTFFQHIDTKANSP